MFCTFGLRLGCGGVDIFEAYHTGVARQLVMYVPLVILMILFELADTSEIELKEGSIIADRNSG
jgi:hypothetical protein